MFERLHTSIPSVDTIDFCHFSKDHIQGLQADILIATDVVHMVENSHMKTFSPDLVDGFIELTDFMLKECHRKVVLT